MAFLKFLEGIRTPFFDWLFSLITLIGDETVFLVIAPMYKYPNLITMGDDSTKIYVQHSADLTVDATWEVKGCLEYA